MTPDISTPCRSMDIGKLLSQIGRMNVLAISGGRVRRHGNVVVELPVSSGYVVRITLDASDTYTVQRVLRRGSKAFVKGTVTNVYCDELGETCYQASCYKSNEFGS